MVDDVVKSDLRCL